MYKPFRIHTLKNGRKCHMAVGALIKKDEKYLLLDRAIPPFGFAGPAGHVDENETLEQALIREILEETGLHIIKFEKLFHHVFKNITCVAGENIHDWTLYTCETRGEVKINEESKSIGWFTVSQIRQLHLEPVWKHWFSKLKIIND